MRTSKLSDKKGWGVVSGAHRGEGSSFTGLGSSLRLSLFLSDLTRTCYSRGPQPLG